MSVSFFTAQTANGNSTSKELVRGDNNPCRGLLYVTGTFDGCTVTMQVSENDSTWYNVNSGAFTAQYVDNVEIYARYVRFVLSSAGVSTSISVVLK